MNHPHAPHRGGHLNPISVGLLVIPALMILGAGKGCEYVDHATRRVLEPPATVRTIKPEARFTKPPARKAGEWRV